MVGSGGLFSPKLRKSELERARPVATNGKDVKQLLKLSRVAKCDVDDSVVEIGMVVQQQLGKNRQLYEEWRRTHERANRLDRALHNARAMLSEEKKHSAEQERRNALLEDKLKQIEGQAKFKSCELQRQLEKSTQMASTAVMETRQMQPQMEEAQSKITMLESKNSKLQKKCLRLLLKNQALESKLLGGAERNSGEDGGRGLQRAGSSSRDWGGAARQQPNAELQKKLEDVTTELQKKRFRHKESLRKLDALGKELGESKVKAVLLLAKVEEAQKQVQEAQQRADTAAIQSMALSKEISTKKKALTELEHMHELGQRQFMHELASTRKVLGEAQRALERSKEQEKKLQQTVAYQSKEGAKSFKSAIPTDVQEAVKVAVDKTILESKSSQPQAGWSLGALLSDDTKIMDAITEGVIRPLRLQMEEEQLPYHESLARGYIEHIFLEATAHEVDGGGRRAIEALLLESPLISLIADKVAQEASELMPQPLHDDDEGETSPDGLSTKFLQEENPPSEKTKISARFVTLGSPVFVEEQVPQLRKAISKAAGVKERSCQIHIAFHARTASSSSPGPCSDPHIASAQSSSPSLASATSTQSAKTDITAVITVGKVEAVDRVKQKLGELLKVGQTISFLTIREMAGIQLEGIPTLAYGKITSFYDGLATLVGERDSDMPEESKLLLIDEHTSWPDCTVEWTTGNYCVTTTSCTELWFVLDPEGKRAEICGADDASWPQEALGVHTP